MDWLFWFQLLQSQGFYRAGAYFPEYKAQWVAHRFGGGVPDMSDLHSTEYVGSALHTFSGYPALRTDLYVPEALLPSR